VTLWYKFAKERKRLTINTRHCSDLYLPSVYLSVRYKRQCITQESKSSKSLSSDMKKFKSASKRFLLEGSFYITQEYFDWNLLSYPSTGNLPVINDC